jgi:hypothetical protein
LTLPAPLFQADIFDTIFIFWILSFRSY